MKKRSIMTISGAVVLLFVSLGLFTSPTENTKNNNSTKVVRTEKSSSSKKAGSSSKENSSKSSSESSKAESKTSSVATNAGVLSFTGQRQMQMGNLDSLRRATWSHIQLQDKDEPTVKRAPQLNYDPVGWHNFKFYYGDGTRQAWLMSRGHLVGYQFSGLNDEPRNLVPETAWFNAGNYTGMNDSNQDSMLYYENRLDSWLATHPNYWLDYLVTPIYQGDELIPRQVKLQYVGLDQDGQLLPINIGGKESTDSKGITTVLLDNVSPNADINYLTGTATNTVGRASAQSQTYNAPASSSSYVTPAPATQNNSRTVYVTGGGTSDVYWYGTERMPANTNRANIITMTEGDALAKGKRHSLRE